MSDLTLGIPRRDTPLAGFPFRALTDDNEHNHNKTFLPRLYSIDVIKADSYIPTPLHKQAVYVQ